MHGMGVVAPTATVSGMAVAAVPALLAAQLKRPYFTYLQLVLVRPKSKVLRPSSNRMRATSPGMGGCAEDSQLQGGV